MPFNYVANLDAVLNALTGYNTTSAAPDLSMSLTTRVVTISREDPMLTSVRSDAYPAVFVRIRDGEEEAAGLGVTGPTRAHKKKIVTYDIVALYRRESVANSESDGQAELYSLARNIEGVFQAEQTLSGTALWCHPERTDFTGAIQGKNGVMVNGALITLRAQYHFR
jgi:hypothetical protein